MCSSMCMYMYMYIIMYMYISMSIHTSLNCNLSLRSTLLHVTPHALTNSYCMLPIRNGGLESLFKMHDRVFAAFFHLCLKSEKIT